jgi:hypothetical protein
VNITRFFAIFTPPPKNPAHHRVEPMHGSHSFQESVQPKVVPPEMGYLMKKYEMNLLLGKLLTQIGRHQQTRSNQSHQTRTLHFRGLPDGNWVQKLRLFSDGLIPEVHQTGWR